MWLWGANPWAHSSHLPTPGDSTPTVLARRHWSGHQTLGASCWTTADGGLPSSHRREDLARPWHRTRFVCLLVGCLTSQQHASVYQGRICSDNFTCCHTEIEVADPTFHLTPSQYTDTGPTSPSADPITPGAWQGSHWSANFQVTGMTRPRKNPGASGIRTRDLPLWRRTPYH